MFESINPKSHHSVALVIGNNYTNENCQLHSCINDAKAVREALLNVGFKLVDTKFDLSCLEIKRAIRKIKDKTTENGVLLVYFSGHGHSETGDNFVMPTNMQHCKTKSVTLLYFM